MSNNNPNHYLAAMPSTVKVGDILVMLSGGVVMRSGTKGGKFK